MELIREGSVMFVKVPEVAHNFHIDRDGILVYMDEHEEPCIGTENIPEGNWTILGKAFELTEEQMIEACNNCGGAGFTMEIEPVCCGNYKEYGCCGHPNPEWEQTQCNCTLIYTSLLTKHSITKDYIVLTNK